MISITAPDLEKLSDGTYGSTVILANGTRGPKLHIQLDTTINPLDSVFPVTIETVRR